MRFFPLVPNSAERFLISARQEQEREERRNNDFDDPMWCSLISQSKVLCVSLTPENQGKYPLISFLCSFSPRAKNQRDKLPEETENEISSAARGTFDSRASLSQRDKLCIFEHRGTKLALESTPSIIRFAREHLLRAARHPHGPRRSASRHGGKSLDGVSCRVAPS